MTEEMKLLLAVIDRLGWEARCTGRKDGQRVTNELVTDEQFSGRSREYQYTVPDKRP